MIPNKAQRTWHSLATKWINAVPYPKPPRHIGRMKIKKGLLSNFIPVEVVNAITGEIARGYIQASSVRALIKWLGYHNHKAEVEQVFFPKNTTFSHFQVGEMTNLPVLIKLKKYQFPYVVSNTLASVDKKK